jgi:hypothetical protein
VLARQTRLRSSVNRKESVDGIPKSDFWKIEKSVNADLILTHPCVEIAEVKLTHPWRWGFGRVEQPDTTNPVGGVSNDRKGGEFLKIVDTADRKPIRLLTFHLAALRRGAGRRARSRSELRQRPRTPARRLT